MKQRIYSNLALIYSHLMSSIDYDGWANYILEISNELKNKKICALELASGIGNIAKKLSKKFDFFVASDISYSMLKQFVVKNINRVSCDMLALPFKNKFNFIFSTFDSINYLTSKKKLSHLLKEVYLCLQDDGIFTFDVSLENNSIRYQRYLNREGEYNGIFYKQVSKYVEKERIHYNLFEIIFEDGKKVIELHKQKIFRFEDYFDVVDKSNFYIQACYEAFTFKNATPESERAQLILRKKRNVNF